MLNRLCFFLFFIFSFPASLYGEEFQLTPINTTIRFELDSTWHMIHGQAHEFTGALSVDNKTNPTQMSGLITITAASLETGGERRDKKMWNHSLVIDTFPTMQYKVTSLKNGILSGYLTIKDIIKPVSLKVKTETVLGKNVLQYSATTVIQWKEFGVADPSIFIARVYDDLKILITVLVPQQ